MAKKRGGARTGAGRRRISFTDEDFKQIETYSGLGISEENIALLLNIHYDTLRNHKKRNIEFSQAIKRGRTKANLKMGSALFAAGMKGNVTAMIFYLKAMAGWSENEKPDTGDPTDIKEFKVTIEPSRELSDEHKKLLNIPI